MAEVIKLQKELQKTRAELKNIRQRLETLKRVHQKDIAQVKNLLEQSSNDGSASHAEKPDQKNKELTTGNDKDVWHFKPIGYIESVFTEKNGTPRQANICQESQAVLKIGRNLFTNPEHSLEGLSAYSHIWILYVFHKNNLPHTKAKVAPPRLDGRKLGVFSTRSPYRPCPIGLSLVKLNYISGHCLHLSGVDILSGTPVLDIKPYIPQYDNPTWDLHVKKATDLQKLSQHSFPSDINECLEFDEKTIPDGAKLKMNPKNLNENISSLTDQVASANNSSSFTSSVHRLESALDVNEKLVEDQLDEINSRQVDAVSYDILKEKSTCDRCNDNTKSDHPLISAEDSSHIGATYAEWVEKPPIQRLTVLFTSRAENDLSSICKVQHSSRSIVGEKSIKDAIISILEADPRSTYRRQRCTDRLYYFTIDSLHVTCWFDKDIVEVLRIKVADREAQS